MFFGRSNKPPKMHDPIGDHDVALPKISPGLICEPRQDGRTDAAIREGILGGDGRSRGQRLDEIGTADDSGEFAILAESERA